LNFRKGRNFLQPKPILSRNHGLGEMMRGMADAIRPTVTEAELAEYLPQVSQWQMVEQEGVKRLEHVFKFKDFAQALSFTNKVGALAEEEGHRPAILTEWSRVRVTWWTHKIHGLHRNDFVMAAKAERFCEFAT
jgi:4a-hydroxytetrahydrobiopterin dehydratase